MPLQRRALIVLGVRAIIIFVALRCIVSVQHAMGGVEVYVLSPHAHSTPASLIARLWYSPDDTCVILSPSKNGTRTCRRRSAMPFRAVPCRARSATLWTDKSDALPVLSARIGSGLDKYDE